jgi:hypothetical protein
MLLQVVNFIAYTKSNSSLPVKNFPKQNDLGTIILNRNLSSVLHDKMHLINKRRLLNLRLLILAAPYVRLQASKLSRRVLFSPPLHYAARLLNWLVRRYTVLAFIYLSVSV